jgi:hypothetical protein
VEDWVPQASEKPNPAQAFIEELRQFHSTIDNTVQQYTINVKATVAEMLYLLENHTGDAKQVPLPEEQELEKMVREIKKLSFKPRKGRAKELRKIQNLLEECLARFSSP